MESVGVSSVWFFFVFFLGGGHVSQFIIMMYPLFFLQKSNLDRNVKEMRDKTNQEQMEVRVQSTICYRVEVQMQY